MKHTKPIIAIVMLLGAIIAVYAAGYFLLGELDGRANRFRIFPHKYIAAVYVPMAAAESKWRGRKITVMYEE